MKKALLYLLLFSYTTIICKPMLPLVADCAAHIFWYSEHMATVHYEHGKYHVHYELYEAAKKGSAEKSNPLKEDEAISMHISSAYAHNFTLRLPVENNFFSTSSALADTDASCLYSPPKAV